MVCMVGWFAWLFPFHGKMNNHANHLALQTMLHSNHPQGAPAQEKFQPQQAKCGVEQPEEQFSGLLDFFDGDFCFFQLVNLGIDRLQVFGRIGAVKTAVLYPICSNNNLEPQITQIAQILMPYLCNLWITFLCTS